MRASEKQKKEDVRLAKEKAKAEVNAALEALVAHKKADVSAQSTVTPVADNTNIASE
jgi:hypothetical protein